MKETNWKTKKITISKARSSTLKGYNLLQGGKYVGFTATKQDAQNKVKLLKKCYKEFPMLKRV